MEDQPHLIEFKKIGDSSIGYISVAENQKDIPFKIERVFWTYFTPEDVVRGHHAHYKTEQVLIAATGWIKVETENRLGEKNTFLLDKPNQGLYLPPNCWHTMKYSHSSVQLVFASTVYIESDYIRDYNEFRNPKKNP